MRADNNTQDQPDNIDKEQVNIKAEAARLVKEQVSSGIWNLQIVIFSYAITIATIIMAFRGVQLEIIASSAIVGLSIIWIWGRLRYKRLYKRLYQDEIRHLQELAHRENFNSLAALNIVTTEKATITRPVASPLTPRQKEILSLIAGGNSNKQIAAQLNLSERTIKNQLGYVFKKLDVEDRTRAVLVSIRNGWILPEIDEYRPPSIIMTSGRTIYETEISRKSDSPISKVVSRY